MLTSAPIVDGPRRNERDGSTLVFVPGGEYILGADPVRSVPKWVEQPSARLETKKKLSTDDLLDLELEAIGTVENPAHLVTLSPFWLGRHPVTNAQYRRFLAADSHRAEPLRWRDEAFRDPEQPVVGVTWDDARAYCLWAGLDLPTEAQWEAAARGHDGRRVPWGSATHPWGEGDGKELDPERADFGGAGKAPQAVGSRPAGAGPFGTEAQAGHVWEWCLDVWQPAAYRDRDGKTDPVVLEGHRDFRVVRGGSWAVPARYLDTTLRFYNWHHRAVASIGFRVAASAASLP